MTYADFHNPNFKKVGELILIDCGFNGDYNPTVEIFLDQNTKECYQVSEKYKKYRKSDVPNDPYEVLPYKEWMSLD